MENKTNKIGCVGYVAYAIIIASAVAIANIYAVYKINSALNKYIDEPIIERANVRGNEKPELFIDQEGKRFYAEIDGKSIEDLLK
ncbi:MAG: hypothetical protein RL557_349 [archaeon]|jgi:hypothetical protein